MIRLVEYFLKNNRVTNMIVLLLLFSGIFSAFTLQREQFPSISFDILQIITQYPGAAPEDVEINVTNKVEELLLEVENIKKMTSMSMENVSIIIAQIDSDAGNPEKTKSEIREAVSRVTNLPRAVTGKSLIKEIRSSSMPIFEFALNGDVPEIKLRKYARELESRLREVSGVSRIEKIGFRKREVKIDVNLKKMKEQTISFGEIMNAIRSRNVRSTGGTIESFVSEKKIMTLSEYEHPNDVKDVIVRANYEGYSVTISDIARITDGFEEPQILYRGNGRPAIALIVSQQGNADIIDLSNALEKELEEFAKSLPPEVKVEAIYDYSILTKIMLDMVITNGLFGFVLVLIVMFFFLDRKSAFWAAFGIPFSIVGAIILFKPFGIKLNLITLTTMILVLGIIVDDAIVISEKIYSLKQDGMDSLSASITGVKKMVLPITAAVATTMLAFAPILFIPGMMGKFTRGVPMVVILILSFSLIEAILFIPAHMNHEKNRWIERLKKYCTLFLKLKPFVLIKSALEPITSRFKKILLWVRGLEEPKKWYGAILYKALQKRVIVISGFIVLSVSLILFTNSFLKFMLDEDIDVDFFSIVIEAPQGTSLKKTNAMIPWVEKIVTETVPPEELQSFTTQIGHHNVQDLAATAGQYSNWAAIKIFLKPAAMRNVTSETIMADLEKKLERLKKDKGFQRLNIELMAGLPVGKAVNMVFISNDDSIRARFEKEALDYLKTIDGVSMIESGNVPGKDEMRLMLNYQELAKVGLTALDVAQTVRTAFDGTVVTSIRKEGEDVAFRVRIQDPKKFRAQGVLNLPVVNKEGRLIPIKHFASIVKSSGRAVLHHYRGKRSVTITANVDTNKITSAEVNDMLREKFEKKVAGVPGLRMKLTGQEEETLTSMGGFLFAMVVVLISIYFILVVLFNSYLQPALIMSVIPFAVLGGFLTLIIHGRPLIFISLMGIMGLIGVVVNDTIVMINHLNNRCNEEGVSYDIIVEGAIDRLRPVLLTTLTTFAGLLPTCYGIGGDLPTIRPLVLVMAWGLLFATVLTLGFIPVLFSFVKIRKPKAVSV